MRCEYLCATKWFVTGIAHPDSGESLIVLLWEEKRSPINPSPGSLFLEFANLLPRKYRTSIRQEISDLRLEYHEAVYRRHAWIARAIIISYYIGLVWSIIVSLFDRSKEVGKDRS